MNIKDFCLKQSTFYFDYVKKYTKDGGKSIEKVDSIRYIKNSSPKMYEIKLIKPIFDFEKTYYKNAKTGDIYFNKKEIFIKEYDEKTKTLFIQLLDEKIDLSLLTGNDFLIVSDLLFLIKNISTWYENFADEIKLLEKKENSLKYDINILKDIVLNENQKEAVKAVFENNYSYIWGPPGTGKTKAVLSSAIMNYLDNGKKVLIVAPTNVALEQILLGVMPSIESFGVDRKRVLRFGIASKNFIDKYPEVCESRGIEKELEFLVNQLRIYERVIEYKRGLKVKRELIGIDSFFEEANTLNKKLKKFDSEIEFLNPLRNLLMKTLKAYHFSNGAKILKETISKRVEYDFVSYNDKEIESNNLSKVIDKEALLFYIQSLENKAKKVKEEINTIIEKIKTHSSSKKINKELFDDLGIRNLTEKREGLYIKIDSLDMWSKQQLSKLENNSSELNDSLIDASLAQKAVVEDSSDLIDRKKELEVYYNNLIQKSTKKRVKESNIIAMTIDSYIQYSLADELEVDHIFCDEVGYSSVIKVLTLFKNSVPITFLGDHMQLPPVSEIRINEHKAEEKSFLFSMSAIYFESMFSKKAKEIYTSYKENKEPYFKQTKQINLKYTHRFDSKLANVLDEFVYKFGFSSASNHKTNIFHIDAVDNTSDNRSSKAEAKEILKILRSIKTQDFMVLTPYKAQEKLIKELVPKEYKSKVMTIHKSQGSEWECVIFSVVDDSDHGKKRAFFTNSKEKHYKSLNLINTVVSRTKKSLIIISNREFWLRDKKNQLIGRLIDISKKLN